VLDQLPALVTLLGIYTNWGGGGVGTTISGTSLGAETTIAGHESRTSRKVQQGGNEALTLDEEGLELTQC
jgi:hypothetical protein